MPTLLRSRTTAHGVILLTLLAAAIVWFGTLGYRALADPDEGRYAEIPREMVASGDWVTPRVNDIKYLDKPPLQYWATALAFKAFGEHEWTVRLWPALTGFLGILLTLYAGWRLFDRSTAILAATVLASSFWYQGFGHIATLDMGLSFFLNAALFAFLLAHQAGDSEQARRRWMAMAWSAVGLAVLSKGLVALLLPGIAILLYCVVHRRFSLLRRLSLLPGLALMLLIVAPWFALVSYVNPEFAAFFFVHEHFNRFLTTTHERAGPLWYYLPIIVIGSVPWLGFLVQNIRRDWRTRTDCQCVDAPRFLWLWCAAILIFFSLSSSKLPAYILPIFPALSLLIARAISIGTAQHFSRRIGLTIGMAIVLMAASPWTSNLSRDYLPANLLTAFAWWLFAAAAVLLVGAIAAIRLRAKFGPLAASLALAVGGTGFAQLVLNGFETISPSMSSRELAKTLRPLIGDATVLYSVGLYDHTLPFYLKRTLTLVQHPDELKLGLGVEPDKWIPYLVTFEQRWSMETNALAVMPKDIFAQLRTRSVAMQRVAESPTYIVVIKPGGNCARSKSAATDALQETAAEHTAVN